MSGEESSEKSVWERRWDSINNILNILLDQYCESVQVEDSSDRENTIYNLLIRLQNFGGAQFHFFHDGLCAKQFVDLMEIPDDDPGFPLPQYITGYSLREHILSTTLEQIAEDLVVIQRALEQRLIAKQRAVEETDPHQNIIKTLIDVDKLTLVALRRLSNHLQNTQQNVLTYFRRSANVRVIPYAPVAMIGVPLTTIGLHRDVGVPEDLLAIPHEVAHYLYWNGYNPTAQTDEELRIPAALRQKIGDNPVRHWTEEIFADVVGCLIAGPVAARSFIDLQLASIGAAFHESDDPHPTPALRPFIYTYTLEKMGLTKHAEISDAWESQLQKRTTFVNREHLFAAYAIVDAVWSIINPDNLAAGLRWSDDVAYDDLYGDFSRRVSTLIGNIQDADLDPEDIGQPTPWQKLAANFAGQPQIQDLPDNWVEQLAAESAPGGSPLQIDARDWLKIFDFGGWITAGPHGRQ
jgi:hypothetical protein